MSCRSVTVAVLVVAGLAGGLGAQAAEPARPAPALADGIKKPGQTCGELPRGGRAYKVCIAAQSRRDTPPAGQPTVKPAFSSR